jgi:endonuclease/exonuclease/phosphatase family metal-dependent hydrolase
MKTSLLKDTPCTPYEYYQMQCLIDSCEPLKEFLSEEKQEDLELLKSLSADKKKEPFIYLKSQAPEKAGVQEAFSVLTLNTCFVPWDYPYLFGGVLLPWRERVEPLAKILLSTDADVVCLQEVHAEDAVYALYEALKETYTYFYGAIGPRTLGFSFDTLGLPSGLFVASKYPIEHPQFTLFNAAGVPMNWGFFDFTVMNGGAPMGHIYATHLQSLSLDAFAKIRALQLQQIVEKMENDLAVNNQIPFFLCGDLNIPYGSEEPGEALIRKHFYDDYNKDQGSVGESNRTCTDYFTNYFFSETKDPEEIDPQFQILDYALLLRSQPFTIDTQQVETNDLKEVLSAVSDHHGLLTTISNTSKE